MLITEMKNHNDVINFEIEKPNFNMSCGALVFNRDDPNGRHEFELASKAYDLSLAIYDFDTQLRNIVKYQSDNYHPEYLEGIDKARDLLRECLIDKGVDLELIL